METLVTSRPRTAAGTGIDGPLVTADAIGNRSHTRHGDRTCHGDRTYHGDRYYCSANELPTSFPRQSKL